VPSAPASAHALRCRIMTYLHPVLVFLTLLALGGVWQRRKTGKYAATAALAGLFLWGWGPTTWLLCGTLEWWFPVTAVPGQEAEAIVVLSGGARPPNASQPEAVPLPDTYLRSVHAAWLYKHWRPLPVIASGGAQNSGGERVILADVMRGILEKEGVPGSMIWTETKSHSTYENAVYTAEVLRRRNIRKIVLVTEGYHMLRAAKCFRRQGLEVVPAACSYRYLQFTGRWQQFIPAPEMMLFNDDCLHEWVGLLWYSITGRA